VLHDREIPLIWRVRGVELLGISLHPLQCLRHERKFSCKTKISAQRTHGDVNTGRPFYKDRRPYGLIMAMWLRPWWLEQLMGMHGTWYEYHATEGHPTFTLSHFVPIISTWRPCEILRSEQYQWCLLEVLKFYVIIDLH